METKAVLRQKMKAKKRLLTKDEIAQKSHIICNKVMAMKAFLQSDRIYAYINYNQEVDLSEIIEYCWANKKKIMVPKVNGDEMDFYVITSWNDLAPGAYNIMEPTKEVEAQIDNEKNGFMILPGLIFDKLGHRIGYGKGFYDRYLAGCDSIVKTAVGYEFQVLDEIWHDDNDVSMEYIVTDGGSYEFRING